MELFFFGFTLWLGAYLLARKSQKATVQLTGWGLLAYALALAIQIIFDQSIIIILLIPALLWIGAALHLLPEEDNTRHALILSLIHISFYQLYIRCSGYPVRNSGTMEGTGQQVDPNEHTTGQRLIFNLKPNHLTRGR